MEIAEFEYTISEILSEDRMADTRRIQKLDQSEPVHAQCDIPRFSLRRMIGIQFGSAQSVFMDEIRLATDIEFGTVDINLGDATYTLSLASALVILEKTNADIVAHSKYSDVLSEGEIAAKASEIQKSSKAASFGADGEASLKTGFVGSVKGMFKRESGQTAEATTHVTHRITLVSPEGQDSWRIGGPDGNPLLETKDLRGPVINSSHGDIAKPLCMLAAIDPDQPVTGRIRIQANTAHFRLRGNARADWALDGVSEGFANDQVKFAKREKSKEQELRERVATMALLKPMSLPDREVADEGMLDLAARSFAFVPDMETPAHEK